MAIGTHISRKLAACLPGDHLVRNVGWLTGAEAVSRLGRIVAAVILARQLDAAAFGIAAIVLTVFELVRVFTENGIGAAVIRSEEEDLHRVANTANRLMWRICLSLAGIQLIVAAVAEQLLPGRQVGLMIGALAMVYLIMPFGLVHAYMLQRRQHMKRLAGVSSAQAAADHVLTAILALTGIGAWAIVLPKLLTAPIWLFGVRHGAPWQRAPQAGFAPVADILKFSLPVLGSELLSVFRDQLDKIIVSLTLGVEALGIYYFAFNAGLGVSTALNKAFSGAFYPYLCAAADKAVAFRNAMLRIGAPLSVVYLAQAGAALIYVPVVFGPDWAHAAPLVGLLCLGGPARLIMDGVRMLARARGASLVELLGSVLFALSVLVPFALAA
ncbi:MAG: oligosaccharide flippase family protein, partial [Hyphomonadaceae bacterium]|nr:oligosaccharide flippase family protein [Hyphomonadaceae bacterium]